VLTVEQAVPVDPEATRALAQRLVSAAARTDDACQDLARLSRSCGEQPWQGAAADSFSGHLAEYPSGLAAIASGYQSVAGALERYAQATQVLREQAARAVGAGQDAQRRSIAAGQQLQELSVRTARAAAAADRATAAQRLAAVDPTPAGAAATSAAAATRQSCERELASLRTATSSAQAEQAGAEAHRRSAESELVQVQQRAQDCARACARQIREVTTKAREDKRWWQKLSPPGVNDWADLANGLLWPSVQRAGDAAARHAELLKKVRQLDADRRGLTGAARSRANKAFFVARAQVRAANRVRLSAANAIPARYVPRSLLYQLNRPLAQGVPVLAKVPLLSIPLTGVGIAMDRSRMSTSMAVTKNVAATAAGIGAVAVAATFGAPVLVTVGIGAAVGYGVGLAVEHWGDDVARGTSSAVRQVRDTAGKAADKIGDAVGSTSSKAKDTVGQLWGKYGW
jgi:uncharacterized protein YukE